MKRGEYLFTLIILMLFFANTVYASSYVDNGNGTISDTVAGLMWQKQDDGTAKTWEAAIAYCEGLVLPVAGYSDWRLPQIKELNSLVDSSRSNPAINTTFFPSTQSTSYWSSTSTVADTLKAWVVDFNSGITSFSTKTGSNYVRCVRNLP
ncbi:MAG: DUF1566 domain-containing protein [Nitrospirota bacterium]|nr:DUF1566 domain-containing protein [Nitrospirota bacterium]